LNIKDINKIDSDNMFDVIKNLYKHIEHSFEIIKNNNITSEKKYKNIIICGMGGSAIGGDFVRTVLLDKISIPVLVNRNYLLPKWVDKDSLVVICSYSGNTEETISCYKQAVKLKNKPIVISSGGFLLNDAIKCSYQYIKLPGGIQPRAAFGYSASLLYLLFCELDLVEKKIAKDLRIAAQEIEKLSLDYSNVTSNDALELASKIHNKFPLIYGTPLTDVASLRFRCQLAENSKILSSHFQIPELDHNEIEGFGKINNDTNLIIWIKDFDDLSENLERIKITRELLHHKIKEQYTYEHKGSSLTVRLFKLIYFFDWVSFYGAIFNDVNPTPVNTILKLKSIMSK